MTQNTVLHQVATTKVTMYDRTMSVEYNEQIFEEKDHCGDVPERQVVHRVEESSDDDDHAVGSARRVAKRTRPQEPPVRMPRGELLTTAEADRCRILFDKEERDRRRYLNHLIRHYRPREIYIRKYRQTTMVNQDSTSPSDDSSTSDDDWFQYSGTYNEDKHVNDDDAENNEEMAYADNTADSVLGDDSDLYDTTESDSEVCGPAKKRKMDPPETQEDASMSTADSAFE